MEGENDMDGELKRELKFTRICCMVSGALTLCLLAAVVMLIVRLQPVYEFISISEPVLEKLAEVDIDTLNSTMETVNDTIGEVDWDSLTNSLSEIDVEAVNELLDNYDPEEFSRTLDNLNSAIETFGSLSQKFSSVTSIFGR
jgi:hypothetical protein